MKESFGISFVMPMFNERGNIENTVRTLKSIAGELTDDYEIVIADDASTDGSGEIIDSIARLDNRVKAYHLKTNTKFGGAFSEAFNRATKDIIVYMDSDLPVSVDDIKLSLPIIRSVDMVTGYSMVTKGETLKRKIISETYNFIVRTLFGFSVKDVNSGYKIVRRSSIAGLKFISHSPFVDVEIFLHIMKNKGKIKQFPLIFLPRPAGKSYIASLPMMWATFRDMLKVRAKAGRVRSL